MVLLLSISPASRVIVGIEWTSPAASVMEPRAVRKPGAVAVMVYAPGGNVKPKTPSGLTVPEAASELSGLSKLTVTGLTASTLPVTVPVGATGVNVGVAVNVAVGVGDSSGVVVNVGVIVGVNVNHTYVETICPKTAVSAASS